MNKKPVTPRIMLVIIAAMFLLPLILAWLMYTGTVEFSPESTKNRGTLVKPPVPLNWQQASLQSTNGSPTTASERFLTHWVVLYPVPARCEEDCQSQLTSLRQVHVASGRHSSRIRLAVLVGDELSADTEQTINGIYDQFILVTDSTGDLFETTQAVTVSTPQQTGTYLVDPLGNIMMVYAADADPNDLKQDLKRLLTWSKLDEQ